MVDKLTIFEARFDGARFGPTSIGSDTHEPEAEPEWASSTPDEATGSRNRRKLMILLVAVGAITAFVAARKRTGTNAAIEIDEPVAPARGGEE